MKDGRCIVRVSLDMLNVIIRRPRIVTVIYGYFILPDSSSSRFSSLLLLPLSFFLLRPLLFFSTEHFFPLHFVLETSRVENPLRGGSFILKIGGQWCVNLRENTRTLVKDSRRSRPLSVIHDERCENLAAPDVYSPLLLVSPIYNVSRAQFIPLHEELLINFFTRRASFFLSPVHPLEDAPPVASNM